MGSGPEPSTYEHLHGAGEPAMEGRQLMPEHATGIEAIRACVGEVEAGLFYLDSLIRADATVVAVVDQVTTLTTLARHLGLLVLEHHIRECVYCTGRHSDQPADELLSEMIAAVDRFVRTAQ